MRIAGHESNSVHRHCKDNRGKIKPRTGKGCLTARMSRPDDDHVIMLFQKSYLHFIFPYKTLKRSLL